MTATFTTSPRVAVFQGIIPVPIATYLNAFTPSHTGWSFGNSPWPVEFAWRKHATTGAALALKGTVFGGASKTTTFAMGDFTAGVPGANGNCIYNQNQLKSFYANATIDNFANIYSYGLNLGTPLVAGIFSGVTIGTITGARIPGNSFTDGCQIGAGNVIYSMNDFDTLVTDFIMTWPGGITVTNGPMTFPLRGLFPTDLNMLVADTNGINWATVGGSGSNGRLLARCDFTGAGNLDFYTLTWDNPTLSGYLVTNFNSVNSTRPTPFGWLSVLINNGTASQPVTIDGKLYTSYMILTSFDGTKYWLLDIQGQDANGQNWQGNIGTAQAVIMPDGMMLIHQTNQDAIVLQSVISTALFKMLPVFPPVSLPSPPPDTELALTLFREENAKT